VTTNPELLRFSDTYLRRLDNGDITLDHPLMIFHRLNSHPDVTRAVSKELKRRVEQVERLRREERHVEWVLAHRPTKREPCMSSLFSTGALTLPQQVRLLSDVWRSTDEVHTFAWTRTLSLLTLELARRIDPKVTCQSACAVGGSEFFDGFASQESVDVLADLPDSIPVLRYEQLVTPGSWASVCFVGTPQALSRILANPCRRVPSATPSSATIPLSTVFCANVRGEGLVELFIDNGDTAWKPYSV